MSVTVIRASVRGKPFWQVNWRDCGKRKRKFFTNQKAAEAKASILRGESASVNSKLAALSQDDQERLLAVWNEAKRRGVDLLALLGRVEEVPQTSMPVKDVIAEMIAVKRRSGLSERYLGCFEMILLRFVKGRERLPVSAFTLADIEKYLDSHNAVSRQCLRGRVSTLMRFAVRRGYRSSNPCEQLEPMRLPFAPPVFLTVRQVEDCLKWLKENPRCLAWFILSTFAGLRPEEADQTSWSAIDFKEKLIRVEAQTSKIRQRRIIYPMPMVFKWLKLAKKMKSSLPIVRTTRFLDLHNLRAPIGVKAWPRDCTRHTAASYWLASCGSAATVATALGHSESVLKKHYMALVTKADAEKFWSISP